MPKNGQCESWRQSLESQVFVVSSAQNKNCHPVRLGSSQWMSPYSTLKIDHNLFGINNKYLPWVLQGAWVFSCFFFALYIYLMMGWVGVGWAGMLTFMLRSWCCVDHGVGWGGMLTFMLCSWCYVDHGVGWGGMLTFMSRSWCYAQKKNASFETIGPPEDIPTCAVLSFISTPTF